MREHRSIVASVDDWSRVVLLDLAPWELPNAYQRSLASRFGQRLHPALPVAPSALTAFTGKVVPTSAPE